MKKLQQPLSMDCVYQEPGTDELKSVRAELYPNPSGEYFDIKFTSSEKLSPGVLEDIINSLWAEWFTRLKINPVDDCRIKLVAEGISYEVAVEPLPKITVTGLYPR